MTIEKARAHAVAKPWGRAGLSPWSTIDTGCETIGEVWFDRAEPGGRPTALLVKLLFTTRPLSIQVHPDDARARALGLANGKTEAWYVLAAEEGAEVCLGPRIAIDEATLRAAIADGSIVDLVAHRPVRAGDAVFVPAGTIHAIGPGLVVAEIQQRSDTTFRLFDHGSDRALHIDEAVAAARLEPVAPTAPPEPLDAESTRLVACPRFVIDRLALPAGGRRPIVAGAETWLLVVAGEIRIGEISAAVGDAVLLATEEAVLEAGTEGAVVLEARLPTP